MIYPQALPRLLLNRSDLRQSLRRKSVENVVLYHALSRFSRSEFTFAYPLFLPLGGNLAAKFHSIEPSLLPNLNQNSSLLKRDSKIVDI